MTPRRRHIPAARPPVFRRGIAALLALVVPCHLTATTPQFRQTDYRLHVTSKHWRSPATFRLLSKLLMPEASAQGGGGCQGCGGGGEGDGSKAAEILLGIAAIMAPIMGAVAAISAASEQAAADKFVATTAATAAITQTKIQADVTRQLSDQQRAISEKNLEVTQQLAREQEANRKERLDIQLAALMQERQAQEAERREVRAIEQKRIDQQIAFAKQQADENLRLAKLAINTQLVQQGLATGVAPAGSRGRLSVGAPGVLNGGGGTLRAVISNESSERGAESNAAGVSGSVNRAIGGLIPGLALSGTPERSGSSSGTAVNPRAVASDRLLSALGNPQVGLARGAANASNLSGTARARGAVANLSQSVSGGLPAGDISAFSMAPHTGSPKLLRDRMREIERAMMSTRGNRNLTMDHQRLAAAASGSDLSALLGQVRSGGSASATTGSFSEFFEEEKTAKPSPPSSPAMDETLQGAYRPPTGGRALLGGRRESGKAHSLGY